MVMIHCVYTMIFLLNLFPNMSENQLFSQGEIVTGLTVDYKCDCNTVVGTYIEANIEAEIKIKMWNADRVAYIWGRLEALRVRSNAS